MLGEGGVKLNCHLVTIPEAKGITKCASSIQFIIKSSVTSTELPIEDPGGPCRTEYSHSYFTAHFRQFSHYTAPEIVVDDITSLRGTKTLSC